MLQKRELPTLSIERARNRYFRTRISEEPYDLTSSWDTGSYATEDYVVECGYVLVDDIAIAPDLGAQRMATIGYVDSVTSVIPKSFEIISVEKKSIRFKNLLEKDNQKIIPKKLFQKLNEILDELKKVEPGLYKYLLKINKEINIDQLISVLEFVGASSLPKNVDFDELLREVKVSSVNAL